MSHTTKTRQYMLWTHRLSAAHVASQAPSGLKQMVWRLQLCRRARATTGRPSVLASTSRSTPLSDPSATSREWRLAASTLQPGHRW